MSSISDLVSTMELIKKLIDDGDIKVMRKMLRYNDECDKLDVRVLNALVKINGYHFVRRNGKISYEKYYYKHMKGKMKDDENKKIQKLMNNIKSI